MPPQSSHNLTVWHPSSPQDSVSCPPTSVPWCLCSRASLPTPPPLSVGPKHASRPPSGHLLPRPSLTASSYGFPLLPHSLHPATIFWRFVKGLCYLSVLGTHLSLCHLGAFALAAALPGTRHQLFNGRLPRHSGWAQLSLLPREALFDPHLKEPSKGCAP